MNKSEILYELYEVIQDRKKNKPENSYVTKLMTSGIDKILKKIGEEASETIIAAKNSSKDEIIWEISDLLFHLWVVLGYFDITPDEIFDKLIERRKK